MRLEHYPLEKLKKEILEIVRKYLDINCFKIFFFGSRVNPVRNKTQTASAISNGVNGKADERSDIDIGIEGPDPISLEVIAQIKDEISNLPTLYHIDIVDFKSVDEDFYKVAKQKIELIVSE